MTPGASAAVGPVPTLVTVERDYLTPTSIVYGATGTVYVLVNHTDSDKTDERDVFTGVEARYDATNAIVFDLLETAPHSGQFIGSFRVKATGASTNAVTDSEFSNFGRTMGDGSLTVNPSVGTIDLKITKNTEPSGTTARTAADGSAQTFADVTRRITWIPSADGQLIGYNNHERCGPVPFPGGALKNRLLADCTVSQVFHSTATPPVALPIPGWEFKIFYTLHDTDRNRKSDAIDQAILFAWSDSDPQGEALPLVETGQNTGVFEATLGFENTLQAGNNLVYAAAGDNIYVAYIDDRDVNGVQQVPSPLTYSFSAQSNGLISFSDPTVAGLYPTVTSGPTPFIQALQGRRDRVALFLLDSDLDVTSQNEAPTVRILAPASGSSPEDPICDARLDQPGGAIGVYVGTIMFDDIEDADGNPATTEACYDRGGAIVVPMGAGGASGRRTFLARYDDTDRTNVVVPREATVVWVPSQNASLVMGPSGAPQRFTGTGAPISLLLTDADSDLNPQAVDKASVRVRSNTNPQNGITVLLDETTTNSGVFAGTFSFSTTGSSGSVLQVADGDSVIASYDDPASSDGRPFTSKSAKAIWKLPRTGVVSADDLEYFYTRRASSVDVDRPDSFARIYVEDEDQNDPRVRDEIRVIAVPFNPPGPEVSMVLKEVGVNSGFFEGILLFTENSADVDANRLYVGALGGDGRRSFRIEYIDPAVTGGGPGTVTSPTLLYRHITNPNVRVVRFEVQETVSIDGFPAFYRSRAKDIFQLGARGSSCCPEQDVTLSVYTAPGQSPPNVEMSSTRCAEPSVTPVSDTGLPGNVGSAADDGHYARNITIRTLTNNPPANPVQNPLTAADNCSNPSGRVDTRQTDTLLLHTVGAPDVTATARPTQGAATKALNAIGGAVLGGNVNMTGEELPTIIEVTSRNDNLYSKGRDLTTAFARSLTDPVPRPIVVLETGVNTDVFRGSLAQAEPRNLLSAHAPRAISARLTNGIIVADSQLAGPAGDRCADGTVSRILPTTTAVPVGMTCAEVLRSNPDGTISTLAVAILPSSTAPVIVNLTDGFDLGVLAPATGARCSFMTAATEVTLAPGGTPTFYPTLAQMPLGIRALPTCAQISVGQARHVLGELVRHGVSVKLTNGAPVPDSVPGVSGDVCGLPTGTQLTATVPGDGSVPGGMTCAQLTRVQHDGKTSTLAVAVQPGSTTVRLTNGMDLGPQTLVTIPQRCASGGSELNVALATNTDSTPVGGDGPFTCGQITIGSGSTAKRFVLGEPAVTKIGSRVSLTLTDGWITANSGTQIRAAVSSQDGTTCPPGTRQLTIPRSTPVTVADLQSVDDPAAIGGNKEVNWRCMQMTRTYDDGSVQTFARYFDTPAGQCNATDRPTCREDNDTSPRDANNTPMPGGNDPIVFRLSRDFLDSNLEGSGGTCATSGDEVEITLNDFTRVAANVPNTMTRGGLPTSVAAGEIFSCVEMVVDPADRSVDAAGGTSTAPLTTAADPNEVLDIYAIGHKPVVAAMFTDSAVRADPFYAGPLGNTCALLDDVTRVRVLGNGTGSILTSGPGAMKCLQLNATMADRSVMNYALNIAPSAATPVTVRLMTGFVHGLPGRDARCGPSSVAIYELVLDPDGAPTGPIDEDVPIPFIPTCVEIQVGNAFHAIGYDRRDGHSTVAMSDLQRNPLPSDMDPTIAQFLPGATRNYDVIRLTGKGETRYNWYDADLAQLSIQRDPIGSQGLIEIRVTGDDILSGRVYGEKKTTVDPRQRTFTIANPYVHGSELVYDETSETARAPEPDPDHPDNLTWYYEVEARATAAEPITDRTHDLQITCAEIGGSADEPVHEDDVTYTRPGNDDQSGIGTAGCISAGRDGALVYECGCPNDATAQDIGGNTGPDVAYQFRLAHRPSGTGSSSEFAYARPTTTQIRTGATQCSISTGDPDGLCNSPGAFSLDYTPAVKQVTLISGIGVPGSGETEQVPVTWDDTVGAYRAFVPVEVVRGLNNDKIFVTGASSLISVRFDDPLGSDSKPTSTNSNDFRAVSAFTTWRPGANGAISFHSVDFQAEVPRVFGASIPVRVTDSDADRTDQPDAVTVHATNPANGDSIDVVLRELGVHSGFFQGYIPVTTSATPTTGFDVAPSGGSISVRYEDAHGLAGGLFATTASIPWQPAETAGSDKIELYNTAERTDQLGANEDIVGEEDALYVTVRDADANLNQGVQDKITVTVFSDGELSGEEIELKERATAPGVFNSDAILFERTLGVKNGKVFARFDGFQQDDVWVRYVDANTEAGRSKAHESVRIQWKRTHDGVVDIEHPFFFGTFSETAAPGVRTFATVVVKDQDCNKSPAVVDVISGSTPFSPLGCRISTGAASLFKMERIPASGTGSGTTLPSPTLLRETGANTGVFMAPFSFRTGATACASPPKCGTPRPVYEVANGERIRASWADELIVNGGSLPLTAGFSDTATWHEKGFGVVAFDKDAYTDEAEKPKVILVDGDIGGTDKLTKIDTVTIKLDSDVLAAPVEVTLTETTIKSGIFELTLSLSLTQATNAATGLIQIDRDDHLVATYTDASPAGTRSISVPVNLLDKSPPETTLTVGPDAVVGKRGVYTTTPTITLAATDQSDIKEVGFKIGASSVFTLYSGPFTLPAGRHVVSYRSVDVLNQEETAKTAIIKVDLANPTQIPTAFATTAIAGGDVELNWTHVPNTLDPFEFFEYEIFRDGAQTPIGNSTTDKYVDSTLTDELSHTYQVAVVDEAGRRAPLTVAASVVPDATLPSLNGPIVSPGGFDVRDPPAAINVSVSAVDKALASVHGVLRSSAGEEIDNQTLVVGPNGKFGGVVDISNVTEPCTCLVRFGAFDVAGNLATLDVAYIITGPDVSPPQATIASPTLAVGTPLIVTVTDNVGVAKVSYRLDEGLSVDVPVEVPTPVVTFEIPAALLALGSHKVEVHMEDNATTETGAPAANNATELLSFTVTLDGGGPGLPPSFFLPTTARVLGNGSILVEWEVPSSLLGIAGFQVWRASSPFEPVANLTSPTQRSYIDGDTESGTAYRYVVTFFTSQPFASLGQVPGYPGSDEAVPASAPVTAGDDGQPRWLWWVFGAIAVIAIAALLAILLAGRRGGGTQQEQVYAPAPPPAEAEADTQQPVQQEAWAQTHRLRCPQCSHRFEVSGTKPIVTNCPNCGRKGILR